MVASQHKSLFQPTSTGGHVFPRLSIAIRDGKLALLERIRQHADHYTRWAADFQLASSLHLLPFNGLFTVLDLQSEPSLLGIGGLATGFIEGGHFLVGAFGYMPDSPVCLLYFPLIIK